MKLVFDIQTPPNSRPSGLASHCGTGGARERPGTSREWENLLQVRFLHPCTWRHPVLAKQRKLGRSETIELQQAKKLALDLRKEKLEADIIKLKKEYEVAISLSRPSYFKPAYCCINLADRYVEIGETDKVIEYSQKTIREIEKNLPAYRKLGKGSAHELAVTLNYYKRAHKYLAAHSFHHFLCYMEWDFSPENKFYADRICVMQDWAKELENLEFGKYDILGLSAPPRSGKTGIGTLFVCWLLGRHPEKSITFNTHTSRMARKEYQDVLNLLTDPKRGWKDIFPGFEIEQSAEDLWIDINPKKATNNYKTFYCSSIDAQKAGVMEASWLIYCDDLIGGIEEALNPARLQTAWDKYATDILQRKNGNVKILHIATRWSVNDPLTREESANEKNPRSKFIRVPGLNEKGESNFMYKYHPLDTAHFMKLKNSMDDVSFSCIVQQTPVERDGLVFTRDSLSYYEGELPEGEPDEVVFASDIAFGGGDFLSFVVAYVYGMDAYIHDVVHSDKTKETTKSMVVSCIMQNNVTRGYMEANNGGSDYAASVDEMLRSAGYRCHIESRRAPTNKSKLTRILDAQSEIKALITDGSGYRLHFLSESAREGKPMYKLYMKHLTGFNQSAKFIGKQKDDAADATAMLVSEVLNRKNVSGTIIALSRKALAI